MSNTNSTLYVDNPSKSISSSWLNKVIENGMRNLNIKKPIVAGHGQTGVNDPNPFGLLLQAAHVMDNGSGQSSCRILPGTDGPNEKSAEDRVDGYFGDSQWIAAGNLEIQNLTPPANAPGGNFIMSEIRHNTLSPNEGYAPGAGFSPGCAIHSQTFDNGLWVATFKVIRSKQGKCNGMYIGLLDANAATNSEIGPTAWVLDLNNTQFKKFNDGYNMGAHSKKTSCTVGGKIPIDIFESMIIKLIIEMRPSHKRTFGAAAAGEGGCFTMTPSNLELTDKVRLVVGLVSDGDQLRLMNVEKKA